MIYIIFTTRFLLFGCLLILQLKICLLSSLLLNLVFPSSLPSRRLILYLIFILKFDKSFSPIQVIPNLDTFLFSYYIKFTGLFLLKIDLNLFSNPLTREIYYYRDYIIHNFELNNSGLKFYTKLRFFLMYMSLIS